VLLRQRRFGPRHIALRGLGVEQHQQVALLDRLAQHDRYGLDLSTDLGSDVHASPGLQRARRLHGLHDVDPLDLAGRRLRWRQRGGTVPHLPPQDRERDSDPPAHLVQPEPGPSSPPIHHAPLTQWNALQGPHDLDRVSGLDGLFGLAIELILSGDPSMRASGLPSCGHTW
jgi:hypothetical protein